MGLNPHRDRLCVVQMSNGDGTADVVQIPEGSQRRAEPEGAARQSEDHQDLSLRALRSRRALQRLRRDAAAGLLHQDRLAADPHLYRPAWPEGSGARGAQHRPVEAAAVERLGRARASAMRSSPMPPPTCCICMACANGSTPCWRAKAAPTWRRPVSTSCRPGQSSISAAGKPRTFLRIRECDRFRKSDYLKRSTACMFRPVSVTLIKRGPGCIIRQSGYNDRAR